MLLEFDNINNKELVISDKYIEFKKKYNGFDINISQRKHIKNYPTDALEKIQKKEVNAGLIII
jgi:hypothetical protein